ARPRRLVVELIRLLIGRDVEINEEQLPLLHHGKRVGQIGLAQPERLDLAAGEDDAGFPRLETVVVMARAFVPGDRLMLGLWVGHAVREKDGRRRLASRLGTVGLTTCAATTSARQS